MALDKTAMARVLSRAIKQMRSAILVAYLPPVTVRVRRHEPAHLCAATRTNLITTPSQVEAGNSAALSTSACCLMLGLRLID